MIESSEIDVEFEFYKFEKPPYWTNERRNDNGRQRIKLNNVKPSELKFKNIKLLWGTNGFNSGAIRAIVTWETGRTTKFWCSTQNEGERVAQILSEFCEENIVFPIVFEARIGTPPGVSKTKYLKNYKQYIASLKIWNWAKINKFERTKGKVDPKDRKRLIKRIAVHYDEEPSWWQNEMNEALQST